MSEEKRRLALIDDIWGSTERIRAQLIALKGELGLDQILPKPQGAGPTGVGWWIWYLSNVLGGQSLTEFGRGLVAHGITHVYIKSGEGISLWDQLPPAVGSLRDAGLGVYAWHYVHADTPEAEARVILSALDTGCDGLVLDIEAECEGKAEQVERLWQTLRAAKPDAWIAHAPLPVIEYHDPEVYKVSCRYASAHLPQWYCGALGPYWGDLDRLFDIWREAMAGWAAQGLPDLPLMPIGQAYDEATVESIARFAGYAKGIECQAISFWSLDAATPEQRAAVEAQAQNWRKP